MKNLKIFILFLIIIVVNGFWLKEERVPYFEKDENGALVQKRAMSVIASPPQNLSRILEKYLHQWSVSKEGAFYLFNVSEPKVTGFVPGVMISAKQAVETDMESLNQEARSLQEKIERTNQFYNDVITKINNDFMNIQVSRIKVIKKASKNSFESDEDERDEIARYDKEWIFNFATAALETETILRGYRYLLKRLNHVMKKMICVREGANKYREGYDLFAMVYPETILDGNTPKNIIEWPTEGEAEYCQFVDASESALRNELYNTIMDSKKKMNKILKDP